MLCCDRRPTSLHDRGRDSDDDDFRDRDYDVAALANNLSQAFRYGIYSNDDIEEVIAFRGILISQRLFFNVLILRGIDWFPCISYKQSQSAV